MIAVDDGSTDGTAGVINSLKDKYGVALRMVRQVNAGASEARNVGLALAQGAFVQFLDSDDILDPAKIALQLEAIADPVNNTPLALCYGILETEQGAEQIGLALGERSFPYVEALCGKAVHIVQTSAPLWRREFLTDDRLWNPCLSLGDDLEFHVRCLADAPRLAFVERSLFTVRNHAGERLSNFSSSDARLASLLESRESIYRALIIRNAWTEACEANTAVALRSIYMNFLRRMSNKEVARFEDASSRLATRTREGALLRRLFLTRRIAGRRLMLAALERGMYASAHVSRLKPGRLWAALGRTMRRLTRMRMSDNITTVLSLTSDTLNNPLPRTALLVEPNTFHTETLPGYVSLLATAGLQTTLLCRPRCDVSGALSRLPSDISPRIVTATLPGIKRFLRGRGPARFDFVLFNSGTIAEPYGYFGGLTDFLGLLPEGQRGAVVVEHSRHTLLRRREQGERVCERMVALRPMSVGDVKLPMLAPVEFGPVNRPKLEKTLRFVTVGRLAPAHRCVSALTHALELLTAESEPNFEVHVVGEASPIDFPTTIRPLLQFHGRLPFNQMYAVLEDSHFLLPLLDSRLEVHRKYLLGNTTGSRQLILGFQKVPVWDRAFGEAYGFNDDTSILHEPGSLVNGLRAALTLDVHQYEFMVEALSKHKEAVFGESLATLEIAIKQ